MSTTQVCKSIRLWTRISFGVLRRTSQINRKFKKNPNREHPRKLYFKIGNEEEGQKRESDEFAI
jgi:hypothetical protein